MGPCFSTHTRPTSRSKKFWPGKTRVLLAVCAAAAFVSMTRLLLFLKILRTGSEWYWACEESTGQEQVKGPELRAILLGGRRRRRRTVMVDGAAA